MTRIWEVAYGKTAAVKVTASTYRQAIERANEHYAEMIEELPKEDMEITKVELVCESVS